MTPVTLPIEIKGVTLNSTGTAIVLAGSPEDTNSITRPRNVVPVIETVRAIKPQFFYRMPGNSIVILKLKAR